MVGITYRGGDMEGVSSNAASEATLKLLVEAIKGMGGASAGGAVSSLAKKSGKAQLKATKDQTKADIGGTKAQKDHTKATKGSTKATKNFAKSLAKAGAGLVGGVLGGIVNAVGGVTSELMGASTNLGAYSSHIMGALPDGLGKSAQALIGQFEGHIDTFRDMASVGAAAGNNLYQFQTAASKAGVSVEMLTGVVKTHAQEFAIGMGSTTAGVKKFQGVLTGVQKGFSKDFMKMGITIQEQTELTADYMAQEARLGRVRGRSNASLTKGAANYINELDKLAKITGISRKEAAAAMKAKQEDPAIKATMMQMESGTKDYTTKLFARLGAISPEIEKGLGQLMVRNGQANDEFTAGLVANNDHMVKAAQLLHSFSQGAEATPEKQKELEELIQAAGRQATLNGKEMGNQMSLIRSSGSSFYDSQIALMGSFDNFAVEVKNVTKNMSDQKTGGADVLTAEQSLLEGANKLRDGLIEKVMPKVEAGFNSVTNWLETDGLTLIDTTVTKLGEGIDKATPLLKDGLTLIDTTVTKLGEFINKAIEFFDKFANMSMDDMKTGLVNLGKESVEKGKEALKEGVDAAAEGIKNIGATIATGYDNLGQSDLYKEANKRLLEINKEQKDINAKIKSGVLTEAQLDKARKRLEELAKEAKQVNAVLTAEKKDVSNLDKLSAFFDGIDWGAVSLNLAAAGAAFLVIKGAIALGSLAIAGLAALSGFLLIGTAVILGIAGAIWLVSDSIGGIADGLKRISEVKIGDNMKKMPGFLGDLAGPLTALAAGGIVAQLGGGGLKKLADGVKEFQDIQVDNLAKTGPALESLYKGVSAFTGDSLLDKAGKFLGGLFGGGGSTSGMKEIAEGLQDFKDVDASGLESIGKGLEGITNFVKTMEDADVDKTNDKIEKLIKNLKEYQKQTANMSGDMSANLSATMKGVMSDSGAATDKLNSSMQTLIELVQAGNKIEEKQLKELENS